MRKIYKITCFVYDHVVTRRIDLRFNHVLKCIQNVLLFSIRVNKHLKSYFFSGDIYIYKINMQKPDEQIFVVPGLLGLLIDLMIIIPSQVSLDELPVYNFLHDWLIGVCVLHILIFLVRYKLFSLSFS